MKIKTARDFRAMLFLSIMSYKNHLKAIFKRPFDIVLSFFKIFITLGLIAWPLFAIQSSGVSIKPPFPITSIAPYLGSVVFLFFTLLIFNSFNKAIKNYMPSMFKPADANILFISPLNRHTIYFYAMLRGLMGNLFSVLIIMAALLGLTKSLNLIMIISNIPLVVIGLLAFVVFIQSFKFFLYSVNKRFKKRRLLNFILYGYMVLIILIVSFKFYNAGSIQAILSVLNSENLDMIPLIGWAKGIFMSLFASDNHLFVYTGLYVVVAALSFCLSIAWARDYYEESVIRIDQIEELRASLKSGNHTATAWNGKYRHKSVATPIRFVGGKYRVFFWKDLLLYKQKLLSRPLGTLLPYLLLLLLGSIIGMNLGRMGNEVIILLLPVCVFGSINFSGFFSVWIASAMMSAVIISGKAIYYIIFNDDKNALMTLAKGLFNYLYCLPGAAFAGLLCLITFLLGSQAYLITGCLGFAFGSLIAIYLILLLSGKMFKRLEYLN